MLSAKYKLWRNAVGMITAFILAPFSPRPRLLPTTARPPRNGWANRSSRTFVMDPKDA